MRHPLRTALVPLSLLVASRTVAGPWGRDSGHGYAQLSYSTLRTKTLATPAGELKDIPEFTLQQVSLYSEFGLGHRLTAIADIGWRQSELDAFDSTDGIGDSQVGLQLQVHDDTNWHLALRGSLQIPTGDEEKGQGLLPTGSGVWEGRIVATAGRSYSSGWVFLELGQHVRGDGLRDGLLYTARAAVHATPRVAITGTLFGLEPWRQRANPSTLGSAAGLGDGTRYLRLGGGAALKLSRAWTVDATVDRAFRAANIARGTTVQVGLGRSF